MFRVQSFQKKQMKGGEFEMTEERAVSMALKSSRMGGQHDEPVHAAAAAVRIQNKFRSWKGRKDFLMMRQRIVKIQVYFYLF